jgi:chloride channel protein, CIC family
MPLVRKAPHGNLNDASRTWRWLRDALGSVTRCVAWSLHESVPAVSGWLESNAYIGKAAARFRTLVRANEFMLIPLALVAGCFAGLAVALMSLAAQFAHVVIYGIPIDVRLSANALLSPAAALTAPAAGGLLLGWMEWWRRRWRISQATDPVEANALRGGRLSLRDSLVVSGQTLISNGCGASVGLEAGYTQIGAGAASLLGRVLNLRRNDLRLMVGCGAAGAIAAAFNAPLAGTFYACELIVGTYSVSSAAPILGASIAASFVAGRLSGAPYSLELSHVEGGAFAQSVALVILAALISGMGVAVMYAVALAERGFNKIPFLVRPVLGGLGVGVMAIYTPQVLAAGHGAMVLDLGRDMTVAAIIAIAALKLCACIVSLSSGFRGGLFFASLFVGCLLGKLYAIVLDQQILGLGIDATIGALTGMATLGVAIVGGPLTMAFLVLEMTRNFEVTATVLAACIVTSLVMRLIFGYSYSTWRLHLRGKTIRSADDVGWLKGLTVASMMRTDIATVRDTATIAECRQTFRLGSRHALFVVDAKDSYLGVALLSDVFSNANDASANHTPIAELARHPQTKLVGSMNVRTAMTCFEQAEADILAVVDPDTSGAIVGFLSEAYARRRYIEELDRATGIIAIGSGPN